MLYSFKNKAVIIAKWLPNYITTLRGISNKRVEKFKEDWIEIT